MPLGRAQIFRQTFAKHAWPPAQSAVVEQKLPWMPEPASKHRDWPDASTWQSYGDAQSLLPTGSQLNATQVPDDEHVEFASQSPQNPPQPSGPHVLPAQLGAHAAQWPAPVQSVPAEQLPHEPPHPSGPHDLPVQLGVHTHFPSGPHERPSQHGLPAEQYQSTALQQVLLLQISAVETV